MYSQVALCSFLLMLVTSPLYALGLGQIKLNSYLNQPLDAEIPLISVRANELDTVRVELASDEQFKRAGIEVNAFLRSIEFKLDRSNQVSPRVYISSHRPVRDPFLDFLVKLSWSDGQLVREYTVLLDPPILMPVTSKPMAKALAVAAPTRNERVVNTPVKQQKTVPVRKQSRLVARIENGRYGPTSRVDTLWDLSKSLRPDDSISMEQMMVAMWRENPRAFSRKNMNGLMAGYTLRIPTKKNILSLNRGEASQEIALQNKEWREDRSMTAKRLRAMSRPVAQLKLLTPTPEPEVKVESLVKDEEATPQVDVGSETTDAHFSKDLQQVKEDIAIAVEETETQKQQTEDLQMRFAAMEEQIASLHRLIRLKDTELAQLQEQASRPPVVDSVLPQTPPREESSWLDDPMIQALILALLVVLVVISIVMKRKATVVDRVAEGTASKDHSDDEDSVTAGESGDQPETLVAGEDVASKETLNEAGVTPVVGATVTEEAAPMVEQDTLDDALLAEIDVYMAYGHYQQVEQLLEKALSEDVGNNALRMKLLEVYSTKQDKVAFVRQAREILAQLKQQKDHPLWQKVSEMGQALALNDAAYEGDQDLDELAADMDASPEEILAEPDAQETPVVQPDVDVKPDPVVNDIARFNVDDGVDQSQNEYLEAGLEPPRVVEEEAVLEFKLDSSVEKVGSEDLSTSPLEVEQEASEEPLLSSAEDESATKLDLARAYLDMEDFQGAITLLKEVLEKGNDTQQQEAKNMLDEVK